TLAYAADHRCLDFHPAWSVLPTLPPAADAWRCATGWRLLARRRRRLATLACRYSARAAAGGGLRRPAAAPSDVADRGTCGLRRRRDRTRIPPAPRIREPAGDRAGPAYAGCGALHDVPQPRQAACRVLVVARFLGHMPAPRPMELAA